MPTYEYCCDACGKSFELEQRITESPVKKCVKCGKQKARRMISGGHFVLKGGGWYADGYSSKGSASKSDSSSGESTTSSSSDSKASSGDKPAKAESKKSSGSSASTSD